jgi:hypothetical protein
VGAEPPTPGSQQRVGGGLQVLGERSAGTLGIAGDGGLGDGLGLGGPIPRAVGGVADSGEGRVARGEGEQPVAVRQQGSGEAGPHQSLVEGEPGDEEPGAGLRGRGWGMGWGSSAADMSAG